MRDIGRLVLLKGFSDVGRLVKRFAAGGVQLRLRPALKRSEGSLLYPATLQNS